MANWQQIREVQADSNVFDRFYSPEAGAAVVYRFQNTLFGYTNGTPFSVDWDRSKGNVQAARLRPESGSWYLYVLTDPRDGYRAEYKLAVANL